MKKLIIILISLFVAYKLLFLDYPYYVSSRNDSERISGFQYPEGSKLDYKRKKDGYKIYKWNIPKQLFQSIGTPTNVTDNPFKEFKWEPREFVEFGEGPELLLDSADIAKDSESISYRTPYHAVELIRSESESSILIISIYNN